MEPDLVEKLELTKILNESYNSDITFTKTIKKYTVDLICEYWFFVMILIIILILVLGQFTKKQKVKKDIKENEIEIVPKNKKYVKDGYTNINDYYTQTPRLSLT